MQASNVSYAFAAKPTPNDRITAPLNASVSIGISTTISTHKSATAIAQIDPIALVLPPDMDLLSIYATRGTPTQIAERRGLKSDAIEPLPLVLTT